MIILGVSGGPRGTHEPGISLIVDGEVKYALIEERYNRYKSSVSCFPHHALMNLFKYTKLKPSEIDAITHPGETYEDMKIRWPDYLEYNFGIKALHQIPVNHQIAHCYSSYFYSDFKDSLVISLDGVGDQKSGIIMIANGIELKPIKSFSPKQSIGFFWNILCQYCGFEPVEEAYKLMGLAALGENKYSLDSIASFNYGEIDFNYNMLEDKWKFISKSSLERYYSQKLKDFLPFPPRNLLMNLRDEDKNLAASAQAHIEKLLYELITFYLKKTGKRNVCFSGGIALNSRANGTLNEKLDIQHMFVPPGPSDVGLSLGSALYAYVKLTGKMPLPIKTPFLGLEYSDEECLKQIKYSGFEYKEWDNYKEIAELLFKNNVIAVLQGKSEYGPRALGHRSILASPVLKEMKDIVNKKIKFREEYRPFAPAVTTDSIDDYFQRGTGNYSYMSFTVKALDITKIKAPAVVHIDGTSRVQEVSHKDNPFFYKLLKAFEKLSGIPILLNTSFNLKGEPIVETPVDAIRTFVSSGLDALIIGKYIIVKNRTT